MTSGEGRVSYYSTVAHLALEPPLVTSDHPQFQLVSWGILAICAEDKVSIYQREGDKYVLRGTVELAKEGHGDDVSGG